MNIFSDLHHNDLFFSSQLLFEGRLGHQLFRPIGLEWWKEGYWKIYDHPDTAEQYLGLRQGYQPKDGTFPLNEYLSDRHKTTDDIYYCEDKHNKTWNKAITLDQFRNMKIDIVIASIPAHIEPFQKLAHLKKAKFIFQMGNVFPEVVQNLHKIPNLMANTLPENIPPSCNYVQYHQEFDLDIFKPTNIPPTPQISSFINVYHDNGGFEDFLMAKVVLPNFEFKSFGGQCLDGAVGTTDEMAQIMRQSYFGFHSKRMGDGFGHILYNWFACGRPIITRISDYEGKMGNELLEHDETCFDLDKITFDELKYNIENLSPDKYQYMCQQAFQRFSEKVNYDREEQEIREFLNRLR